jgi:hypothetical protein
VPLSFEEVTAALTVYSVETPEELSRAGRLRQEVDFLVLHYGMAAVRTAADSLRYQPATDDWGLWCRRAAADMVAAEGAR